jgi:thiamine pyrophosphate-dependent acetolactate synthase large subunit-like protein
MNINVKTKIRYQGREYASPEELPAEVRAAYEQAMSGTPGVAAASAISKKIVLNGQTFSNEDEMPAAERKLYDDAIKLMRDSSAVR